jgi:uncharacterized protein YfdQ (DUF2303 family)
MELLNESDNFAETLAREIKQPIEIGSVAGAAITRIAMPPGWNLLEKDDSKRLPAPLRKTATIQMNDVDCYIDYIKRHGSLSDSTIWCSADYAAGKVGFTVILNDNGEDEAKAAWRDHTARFTPRFSEEWNRWSGLSGKSMSQVDFASFIEENRKDIVSPEGSGFPSAAAMLEMALQFEATQDMRLKSHIRLQNGGISMSFIQDDDDQTIAKMQVFEKFAIGVPVFWNGDAYQVDVRLKYRTRDQKVTFSFELVRADKVLEAASNTVIAKIKDQTGNPFFFGNPFAG